MCEKLAAGYRGRGEGEQEGKRDGEKEGEKEVMERDWGRVLTSLRTSWKPESSEVTAAVFFVPMRAASWYMRGRNL